MSPPVAARARPGALPCALPDEPGKGLFASDGPEPWPAWGTACHSHWADEAIFEIHAKLPRTDRFVERAEQLIDHPFDVARTQMTA